MSESVHWIATLVLTLGMWCNLPVRATVDISCYQCSTCPQEFTVATVSITTCANGCAIWTNRESEVHRGCREEVTADDQLHELCYGELCNGDLPATCIRCAGPNAMDCAETKCPSSRDRCYRNLADGQRGCTSDEAFANSCVFEHDCLLCNTSNCNGFELVTADQLRYPTVHLLTDKTRKANFFCYSCEDCSIVDEEPDKLVECVDLEECITAYDWDRKLTLRGCANDANLSEYPLLERCQQSECNVAAYPTHLQCHQCENCDQALDDDINFCPNAGATSCFTLLREDSSILRGCNLDEAFTGCEQYRNCRVCKESNCNRKTRTSALRCDICDSPAMCQGAAASDCLDSNFYNSCFMYVDGATMVKGCMAGLPEGSLEQTACYAGETTCDVCDTSGCNRLHCTTCNSRVDADCIAGTAELLKYDLCKSGCRTIVDDEGYTVRGCVDIIGICESDRCSTVFVPGGNTGVFPAGRPRCYRCSGDGTLDDCWMEQTTQASYCPIYLGSSDSCYIYNDGQTIERGCTSDVEAKCKTVGDQHCSIKSGSQSNGETIAMPLTCYHCEDDGMGGDCPSTTCAISDLECFVRVDSTGTVSRGCREETTVCEADDPICLVCSTKNCNIHSVCAKCDHTAGECSQDDPTFAVCTDPSLQGCTRYQNQGLLGFDCLDAATECNPDGHCASCTMINCNLKSLAECYRCTDCPEQQTDNAETILCSNPEDQCFTGFDGVFVNRGCQSEIVDIETYRPIEECSEPACNGEAVSFVSVCQQCEDCDHPDSQHAGSCPGSFSPSCYTLRTRTGTIVRGCTGDAMLADCDQDVNCKLCHKNGCNSQTFGPHYCISCIGYDCKDYNEVQKCANERNLLELKCISYEPQGVAVLRGCLGDSAVGDTCPGIPSDCLVSDENYAFAYPVTCIDCTSDGPNGAQCLQNPGSQPTRTFEAGSCIVRVNVDGTLVRGGSLELQPCTDGDGLCIQCPTDSCNNDTDFLAERLRCHQCSGRDCVAIDDGSIASSCLSYMPRDSCYTLVNSEDDVVRGCVSDGTVCGDGNPLCSLCDGNGCNAGGIFETATHSCISCSGNRECNQSAQSVPCDDLLLLNHQHECYTAYSGPFVVGKGCWNDPEESNVCKLPGNAQCQRCFGDNCNSEFRCLVCDSRNDPGCLDVANDGSSQHYSDDCTSEGCVAFIDAQGFTVRGCVQQLPGGCPAMTETCRQCTGTNCNGGLVPGNRLQCHQCSGATEACLVPAKGSASACAVYHPDDECYTYYEDQTTVHRGCYSEKPNRECTELCQTCNTSECNDHGLLNPNDLSCIVCEGPACEQDMAMAQICPGMLPLGQTDRCYTFQSDGDLRKGCLSQLDDADLLAECNMPSSDICETCQRNNCNADKLERCYVCDSATSPECLYPALYEDTGALVGTCRTAACVTLIDGSVTRRACAEDYEQICNADTDVLCDICSGPTCNEGIFPTNRLSCYQCNGAEDCAVIDTETEQMCKNYDARDECYSYVTGDDERTYRGCLSDSAHDCRDTNYCVTCGGNGCNNEASSQESKLSCAQCVGTTCDLAPSVSQRCPDVLLGRPKACYTFHFNDEVLARGCLNDADLAIQTICQEDPTSCLRCNCNDCNFPPTECVVCDGQMARCGDEQNHQYLRQCQYGSCVSKLLPDGSVRKDCLENFEELCTSDATVEDVCHGDAGCNDVLYPPNRSKCYQCSGEECANPALTPSICEPYQENDQCYSRESPKAKGCLSLSNGACDDGQCEICSSADDCDEPPKNALRCVTCNSRTSSACIAKYSGEIPTKNCLDGACLVLIDENGYTVKGCSLDFISVTCTGSTCHQCTDGDYCNNLFFPANRLQCTHCSGPLDCIGATTGTVCERYDPAEQCYTYAADADSVQKGCLSDIQNTNCRAGSTSERCTTCNSRNNCNDQPLTIANPLTCYRCSGADCDLQQTGQGVRCPDIPLGSVDRCYSHVTVESGVRRGCLSDVDACDPSRDPASCFVCQDGNACNGVSYREDPPRPSSCLQCDETSSEACGWSMHPQQATICTVASSHCYTCRSITQHVLRGCVGDAQQSKCQLSSVVQCPETGCNTQRIRSQSCIECSSYCDSSRGYWTAVTCAGDIDYDNRGCYLLRDPITRNVMRRGCVSDLSEDDRQRCIIAKDTTCTTCLRDHCNGSTRLLDTTKGSFLVALSVAILLHLGLGRH